MSNRATQWFWLDWGLGRPLTLGTGQTVGSGHLLDYYDPSPITVNFMAVSSVASGYSATWTIPGEFYTSGGKFTHAETG